MVARNKIIILWSLIVIAITYSKGHATDVYGLNINESSNVSMLTLNKSGILYYTGCNNDNEVDFSYYDGISDSSDSNSVYFELDGVHGYASSCSDTFKNLIQHYGMTTCNFDYSGNGNTYNCNVNNIKDEYSGVVVFGGTITGAHDYRYDVYYWAQVCGIIDDALQQADCFISYSNATASDNQPPLYITGDGNGSMFYICVDECTTDMTQAQYNESMEVIHDIQAGLKVVEIILSLLIP